MNIVYLLTNLEKDSGKRFYVGSKQDCVVCELDGVQTMFSIKTNTPYVGSSSCPVMNEELKKGARFEVTILEEVPERDHLYEKESEWISHYDAVNSKDFYNIGDSLKKISDQDCVVNLFGEIYRDYASNKSLVSRRDGTARGMGYSNFGVMVLDFYKRVGRGESPADMSRDFEKHRKFVSRYLSQSTPEDIIISDIDRCEAGDIRDMYKRGASLPKACEILDISIESGRVLLGDFTPKNDVATGLNMTKEEAEVYIADLVINHDYSYSDVNEMTGISITSVSRYFVSYVRKRLKGSDL